VVLHERPETLRRRWTGIEPAGRGSLVPAALKAVESTRYPDTSAADDSQSPAPTVQRRSPPPPDPTIYSARMKKILLLLALVGLAAFAAKKIKS
jgi:hypothetical protein